jgi:class 3 adenylate cyclase
MKMYRETTNSELLIPLKLHRGRAIAGVIDENIFAYELWGGPANTALRMESHGETGRIRMREGKILELHY